MQTSGLDSADVITLLTAPVRPHVPHRCPKELDAPTDFLHNFLDVENGFRGRYRAIMASSHFFFSSEQDELQSFGLH